MLKVKLIPENVLLENDEKVLELGKLYLEWDTY